MWSSCSVTCESGSRMRSRRCYQTQPLRDLLDDASPCIMALFDNSTYETEGCEGSVCPQWSEWMAFGACSKTCGVGGIPHTRTCLDGVDGITNREGKCEGEDFKTEPCG